MKRTQIRELTFKLIYSSIVQKEMNDEQVELFMLENNVEENSEEAKYINTTYNGIKENEEEIKDLISGNLKEKWTMSRISKIDFAILELAIYELIYSKLPYKVVINCKF